MIWFRLKGLQCKDLSRVDRQVQKVMKEILPLQKALEDSKVLQEETMEEVKKEKKIIEGKEKEFLEKLKQNEIKWKQVRVKFKKVFSFLTWMNY